MCGDRYQEVWQHNTGIVRPLLASYPTAQFLLQMHSLLLLQLNRKNSLDKQCKNCQTNSRSDQRGRSRHRPSPLTTPLQPVRYCFWSHVFVTFVTSKKTIKKLSLLYGLEACPLVKSDLAALDFVINRFFMKLFQTNNIDIVKSCQLHFNFDIPSALWVKRVKRFNEKFSANTFCKITESSRVHVMFV